jgi:hypothetical protein
VPPPIAGGKGFAGPPFAGEIEVSRSMITSWSRVLFSAGWFPTAEPICLSTLGIYYSLFSRKRLLKSESVSGIYLERGRNFPMNEITGALADDSDGRRTQNTAASCKMIAGAGIMSAGPGMRN